MSFRPSRDGKKKGRGGEERRGRYFCRGGTLGRGGIGCPRDKCKANIFATAATGSREKRDGGRRVERVVLHSGRVFSDVKI